MQSKFSLGQEVYCEILGKITMVILTTDEDDMPTYIYEISNDTHVVQVRESRIKNFEEKDVSWEKIKEITGYEIPS